MLQNVPQQPLLSAGDMSQTTLASSGVYLGQLLTGSFQAIYTGSPVGTLIIQGSNDNVPLLTAGGANPAINVTNWTAIDLATVDISAAGSKMFNLQFMGYLWARAFYTKTSGTGALTIKFCGKG